MPSSTGRRSSPATPARSRQRERTTTQAPDSPAVRKSPDTPPPDRLKPEHRKFCLAYLANGFNATAAYRTAYPDIKADVAPAAASRLLRHVKVAAFIAGRIDAVCKPLQMGGEEALAHIAIIARDERQRTNDRLKALRSLLEVTGKVKSAAGVDELAEALRQTLEQNAKKPST